jgi:hypothetical protein
VDCKITLEISLEIDLSADDKTATSNHTINGITLAFRNLTTQPDRRLDRTTVESWRVINDPIAGNTANPVTPIGGSSICWENEMLAQFKEAISITNKRDSECMTKELNLVKQLLFS